MESIVKMATVAMVSLTLVGCAQPPKPLYMWETFPRMQYEALMGESGSANAQILVLQAHAEKAQAANAALPPGFRAHMGMLHLATGNADAARQMWQAEKAAFPESASYMDGLLKRLDTPPAPAPQPAVKRKNPA